MCHSRELNRKINKLHERTLRVVYKNNDLTFEELLNMDDSLTIHGRNLQKLATEMYKVKHNLCPKPFQELFTPAIRGNNDWVIHKVRTVNKGVETIRYRGPKTWELVSVEIIISKSLSSFKEKIKSGNLWVAHVDCVKLTSRTWVIYKLQMGGSRIGIITNNYKFWKSNV